METRKVKVDIKKTTEILDVSEIPQLCRVCLCNDGKMTQIFESKRINVVDKVQYCTGVLVTKEVNLPTLICNKCLRDLAVAFRFKTRFLQSSQILKNSLTSVKNETQLQIKDEAVSETTSEHPLLSESFVECVVTVNEDSGVVKSETEDEDDLNEGKKSEEGKGKSEVSPSADAKTKQTKRVRSTRKIAGDKNRKPKVTKFRKLYCEPCDIKFSNKRESDEHKKALHTNPGAWMCDMCGKAFAHRPSLYTHVRSHLPPRHPCDRCEYKAWSKSDLDKHTRIHTGNRQYQCEFCSSAFFTSSNLACHIRRSHEGVKRFPCTRCERAFFDATELRRHMDAHNDVKRHECEVCHACFTRRRYWKRHLERQHSVVVPPQRPGRKKTNFLVETSSAAASL